MRLALRDLGGGARGLPEETLEAAASAYARDGYLVVDNVLDVPLVDALRDVVLARADDPGVRGRALSVTDGRVQVVLPLTPPFDAPAVYALPPLLPLLHRLLGPEAALLSFGAVVAPPGCGAQNVHLDAPRLFGAPIDRELPAYGVTVGVPLVDLGGPVGGTTVLRGSNRAWGPEPPEAFERVHLTAPRGSVYLWDYRTSHYGMPNTSDVTRPLLYVVYGRPWFRDHVNFSTDRPLRVPRALVDAAPSHLAPLFAVARMYGEAD